MTAADSSAESSNASNAGARVYTVEDNYSEVIEDGAAWVKHADHLATVAALNELQRESEAERETNDRLRRSLNDMEAKVRAEWQQALTAERTAREKAEANERRYLWLTEHANKGIGGEWAEFSFKTTVDKPHRYSVEQLLDAAIAAQQQKERG